MAIVSDCARRDCARRDCARRDCARRRIGWRVRHASAGLAALLLLLTGVERPLRAQRPLGPFSAPADSDSSGGAPFVLTAGVRGWPTPAGTTRGVVVGTAAHYETRWVRARAAATVTDQAVSIAGASGPRLLDGRAVLATAPLRSGALGADLAAGIERDAYDPRGTWAQRGAQLRGWAGVPGRGAWASVGLTAPSNPGATPRATEWHVGGWARRGRGVLSAVVRSVVTHRLDEIDTDSSGVDPRSCYQTYDATRQIRQYRMVCARRLGAADAVLGLQWGWRATTLQARVGHRLVARLPTSPSGAGPETWAGAGVILPPLGPLALALDYLRQPRDVVRGIPATARFFAGFRWAPVHRGREQLIPSSRTAIRTSPGEATGTVAERTLVFALGAVGSAEVRGDFTAWQPVPLARATDGTWQLHRVLTPGMHTLTIRIDSGPWQVPPDLPGVDDGFGGTVGMLVVEPAPIPPTDR